MNFPAREDISITFKEAKVLASLTSAQFGAIKNDTAGIEKRALLEKAVNYLDNLVIQEAKALTEAKHKSLVDPSHTSSHLTSLSPIVYLYLGHFNLLLERIDDAFSAYKEYYDRFPTCYSEKSTHFLYGFGICYFRFDCYLKAISLFKDILFLDRFFVRISDVHFRLGFAYSVKQRFTDLALKHFQKALVETESGLLSRFDIIFQIACLFERQNKIPQALEFYHEVLSQGKSTLVPSALHFAYQKLGYLYQKLFEESKEQVRHLADKAIQYYRAAIEIDNTNAKTWYYLGRVYAALGSIHDAFMTFRNSIDKAEADADTWCSIGTLYQQQNQSCDALQAYFCAVQIESEHASAWKNLGVLYESNHQYIDALHCYQKAIAADKDKVVCPQEFRDRVNQMADKMSEIGEKYLTTFIAEISPQQKLPSVDEASQLPIPAELTQRRMMQQQQQQQQAEQQARGAGLHHGYPSSSGSVAAALYQNNGHGIYGPPMSNSGSTTNPATFQEYYGYSAFATQGMLMAQGSSTTMNTVYLGDLAQQRLKSDHLPVSGNPSSMEQPPFMDATPLTMPQLQWMHQLQSLPNPTPLQRQQLQQLQSQYARSQLHLQRQQQLHQQPPAQHPTQPPQNQAHPMAQPHMLPQSTTLQQSKDNVVMMDTTPASSEASHSHHNNHGEPTTGSSHTSQGASSHQQHSQAPSSSNTTAHAAASLSANSTNPPPQPNYASANNTESLMMDFDPVNVPDEFLNAWNSEEDLFRQFNNCLDGNGGLDMESLFENNADSAGMNTLGGNNAVSSGTSSSQVATTSQRHHEDNSQHDTRSHHLSGSNTQNDVGATGGTSHAHTPHTPATTQPVGTPNTPQRHHSNNPTNDNTVNNDTAGDANSANGRGGLSETSGNNQNASQKQGGLNSEASRNPNGIVPSLLMELIRMNHPDLMPDGITERESVGVPNIAMSSAEILECMKAAGLSGQQSWPSRYLPKRDPIPRPPLKPFPGFSPNPTTNGGMKEDGSVTSGNAKFSQPHPLLPSVPALYLESKKEVESDLVQEYCLSMPTVVIRNICHILRMDMTLFSSKHLSEMNPSHPIEIRRQTLQGPLDNFDSSGHQVWHCESSRVRSTIKEYAEYQAKHFVQAKRGERKLSFTQQDAAASHASSSKSCSSTQLRFGTNCDLSDYSKWSVQIDELGKLPSFLRVKGAQSMLSYVGYEILGMNTVQLYMKVPGCRTPGHQENLAFCSVNINTGPGDCEWFCVAEQYWGEIYRLCQKNKVDYLKGSWWPNLEELLEAGIPVYRFVQRPGDLVWINTNTVHWVQATGFCNNIAWNVGPLTGPQYEASLEKYEFNQWDHFKSIVPMLALTWNMAKGLVVADRKLYELMRYTMMRCIIRYKQTENLLNEVEVSVKWHGHEVGDITNYCDQCEEEIFAHILTRREEDSLYHPYCLPCALRMDRSLRSFVVLAEYTLLELQETYDKFIFRREPIPAFAVGKG